MQALLSDLVFALLTDFDEMILDQYTKKRKKNIVKLVINQNIYKKLHTKKINLFIFFSYN